MSEPAFSTACTVARAVLSLHLSESPEKRGTLPSHASHGAGLLQEGEGGIGVGGEFVSSDEKEIVYNA